MCEILLRVVDKDNLDDFHKHCQLAKAGSVIVVAADGWPWGRLELDDPAKENVIVKLPNIEAKDIAYMTNPQPLDATQAGGKATEQTLRSHAFKLDISGVQLEPVTTLQWSLSDFQARVSTNAYIADPSKK